MPSPCQRCAMLVHKSTSPFLHGFQPSHPLRLRNSSRFRCVLHQIVPRFSVSSSLTSVLTPENVIAAAAAAANSSGSVHGAVSSAITQVAVTAVAIASGACLSTKVDFLWPKLEEQPGAEGYCFCKKSTPWTNAENRRPIFNTLHSYWKNFGSSGPIKW